MHTLTLDDGLSLRYRLDGAAGAPALVFSNSLGTDLRMWNAQARALGDAFTVVRYDTRGHGGSGVPFGPVTLERLGRDLVALLDHLGLERVHLCGLSLGGLTAQWFAVHHPARLRRLVLSNTAARIGGVEAWEARTAAVEAGGMAAIADTVLARFFSPAFRATHPERVEAYGATLRSIAPAGYAACCAALRDADLRPVIDRIAAPTLVVAGALDEATPPAQAAELRAAIAGCQLVVLDGVAHLANVEAPGNFSALLRRFLLN